jgi:hypothetical protein
MVGDGVDHFGTLQQEIDANPIVYFDLRGVVDAAQHELCPDTLGKG